jgi:type I restriction enzyme S subunit
VEAGQGAAQPNISQTVLKAWPILLPPIEEQKRIVDVVSSVDAYIDALQQQADTARTAFLAICEEIFLTGENMKPLHEVATVIMGQSPEGSTCNTDGIGTPLLTGPTEFTKRIVGPPRQWTSKETKLSKSGDILFCVRGATAGRINIGNYKSVIGRGLAAIRCGNSEDTNFVRFALLVGLGQLLPAAGGTIFPNISQSQLRNFEVSWPSENRRAELSGLVRSIEEVVLRTEHAIDDAKKLRSGLLFDLLSGEHEIPTSYDKFLGAA